MGGEGGERGGGEGRGEEEKGGMGRRGGGVEGGGCLRSFIARTSEICTNAASCQFVRVLILPTGLRMACDTIISPDHATLPVVLAVL